MVIGIRLIALGLLFILIALPDTLVSAQYQRAPAKVTFHNLAANYYLSRDSRGLSLLTTEETILADFPAGGFSGITRSIPKTYQGHTVTVKVMSVSDPAGNPIPFKTSDDGNGNIVITTGDPDITLAGFQTYKIEYQTSGVINLAKNADELLLDVNGRDWDTGFEKVAATLHIPKVFQAKLNGEPSCYTSLNDKNYDNCELHTEKKADETVVTVKATNLAAHQALILKASFTKSTFTNDKPISKILIALLATPVLVTGLIIYKKAIKKKKTVRSD
jgi:hypothetical protein